MLLPREGQGKIFGSFVLKGAIFICHFVGISMSTVLLIKILSHTTNC
jgi:hypothetical protein